MKDSEPESRGVGRSRVGPAVVTLAIVLVGVLAYRAYPREIGEGERFGPPPGTPASHTTSGSVGTSGTEPPAIEGGAEPVVASPAVIQELETITGSVDGRQLIGRRVDLHAVVQAVPNDEVFWIGAPDNRVLVVLAVAARGEGDWQHGERPRHHILTVHTGQYATISGSIQRIPSVEEMHNWHLTESERAEALDRTLYIRAETVTANGHGTH